MKTILIFLCLFFALSCGIKGPPLPPLSEVTIQKQKAEEEQRKTEEPKKANKNGQASPKGP